MFPPPGGGGATGTVVHRLDATRILPELLLLILCRAASSAALSHTRGFIVRCGVHDCYTFQCGLVGSFTSPGIDTS